MLCAGSVTISGYLMSFAKTASAARDEKKTLHLHYSILTSSLISAQGHQYFWHFSGGINIEWMSLCCARGAARLGASTKITWICLLACSLSRRSWRQSLRSLSVFNIMHHKQYPIWTAELWKYTVWAWEEMTRDQPAVWVMSERKRLGVKQHKFMFGYELFLLNVKGATWWFILKKIKIPFWNHCVVTVKEGIISFGCLPESNSNVALGEFYQSMSICLLTAEGLRPLCSESSLIPLIESPSLPQFPFDSDQAQQPLSHFLTLLILRQSLEGRLALAQSPFLGRRGGLANPPPLASKGKANRETEIVLS